MLPLLIANIAYAENLPPDPGEAGKATLAGIDSDNDGVRDDVQRWIAASSQNSKNMREVLTQGSKAMQDFLLEGNAPTKAFEHALQIDRAKFCAIYIAPVSDTLDLFSELKAKMLNTRLRSKAWLQADHHLSGKFFSVPDNMKSGCNFNLDAMPN